jgi:hypothetical protein
MGARRGKPLSKAGVADTQAGAQENQGPLVPGAQPGDPQPQPYGSAIYGPEGTYTGYIRSPFGPIRSRKPLSGKSQRSTETLFNFFDKGRMNPPKTIETDKKEETPATTPTPAPSYSPNKQKRLERKSERYKARSERIDNLLKQYGTTGTNTTQPTNNT